jgi:hypothetical protein
MKTIWIIPFLIILPFLSDGQSSLKKVILNKDGVIPFDWINQVQQNGEWEYVKTVTVRRKSVKDYYLSESGKNWNFENDSLVISPYNWKIENQEYSSFSINYFKASKTIVISTTIQLRDRSFERKEIYKVINLTREYLILEEIKDSYCFDYSKGRKLTKKECKEKSSKEPKRLIRGGKQINIGRKPPKYRLIFKLKK